MTKKSILSASFAVFLCVCCMFSACSPVVHSNEASLKILERPDLFDFVYEVQIIQPFSSCDEMLAWVNEIPYGACFNYINQPADDRISEIQYCLTTYEFMDNTYVRDCISMFKFNIDGNIVTAIAYFEAYTHLTKGNLIRIDTDEIKPYAKPSLHFDWVISTSSIMSKSFFGKSLSHAETKNLLLTAQWYGIVNEQSSATFAILDERPVSNQEKDALEIELAKIINENIAFVEYIPEK